MHEIGLIVGMSGCAIIVETYLLGGREHLGEVVKVAMVDYEIHGSRMVVAVVDEHRSGDGVGACRVGGCSGGEQVTDKGRVGIW